jgi:uncharacterized protein YwbE
MILKCSIFHEMDVVYNKNFITVTITSGIVSMILKCSIFHEMDVVYNKKFITVKITSGIVNVEKVTDPETPSIFLVFSSQVSLK